MDKVLAMREKRGRAPHGARGLKHRDKILRRESQRRAPHGARGLKQRDVVDKANAL